MPELIVCYALLVAALLYAISKHTKYIRLKKLTKLIAWCVTDDSKIHRYNLDLIDYIQNAQSRYVSNIYLKITSDEEREIAKEILKAFQADITQNFFRNPEHFEIPKSKHIVTGERYYMYLLLFYLNEHQYDREFLKHEIYSTSKKLTEFGVVFHKLLFISWMFFKNSDMTTQKLICWPGIEDIPKQIQALRNRPFP